MKKGNGDRGAYRVIGAEFELPVDSPKLLPRPGIPEIAFIGRSNVGKSSLVNYLCGRKSLARTSRTPGRTQALNFFRIQFRAVDEAGTDPAGKSFRFECFFVDLPGYGYAKVSKDLKRKWRPLIGGYLTDRESLEAVVLLIDCRREPGEEEKWIAEAGKKGNLWVALTKCDKISKNAVASVRDRMAKELGIERERIVPVSVTDPAFGRASEFLDPIFGGIAGKPQKKLPRKGAGSEK